MELLAGELWDGGFSSGTDGVNHLSAALPQGNDGLLGILG